MNQHRGQTLSTSNANKFLEKLKKNKEKQEMGYLQCIWEIRMTLNEETNLLLKPCCHLTPREKKKRAL